MCSTTFFKLYFLVFFSRFFGAELGKGRVKWDQSCCVNRKGSERNEEDMDSCTYDAGSSGKE